MLRIIGRSFMTSCCTRATQKTLLGDLRKKTGFSLSNCKKALQKFDNNISEAEAWLYSQAQAEGWARASKLAGRHMSQGLVGVLQEKGEATMVELNCETDFVARTPTFIDLVSTVTKVCHQHALAGGLLNKPEAVKMDMDGSGEISITVADLIATNIGTIGENLAARRGVHYGCRDGLKVATYVHQTGAKSSTANVALGRYAALVLYYGPQEIGTALAQHVVGMNPKEIGEPPILTADPSPPTTAAEDPSSPSPGATDPSSPPLGAADPSSPTLGAVDPSSLPPAQDPFDEQALATKPEAEETRLLHQEFLLDPDITVAEYLDQHNALIKKFVRYECGEELT